VVFKKAGGTRAASAAYQGKGLRLYYDLWIAYNKQTVDYILSGKSCVETAVVIIRRKM